MESKFNEFLGMLMKLLDNENNEDRYSNLPSNNRYIAGISFAWLDTSKWQRSNKSFRDKVDNVFGEIHEDEKVLHLLYDVFKKEDSPDQVKSMP